MSEGTFEGGAELDFEGGFFEEAGISGNDVPDDKFGFGKEFWPLVIMSVGNPKVTRNADKVGMSIVFAIDHPRFQGTPFAEKLGNGNWYQLPVPAALQGQIPWDKTSDEAKEVIFNLGELYKALGFNKTEYSGINGQKLLGRRMFAKISAKQNEQGFWNFNLWQTKPIPDGQDGAQYAGTNNSPQSSGMTEEEILKKELGEA